MNSLADDVTEIKGLKVVKQLIEWGNLQWIFLENWEI